MLYSKSAELRDLFIKTLNCVKDGYMLSHPTTSSHKVFQSINFKDKVKFTKGSASDEGNLQKNLLLCIVR